MKTTWWDVHVIHRIYFRNIRTRFAYQKEGMPVIDKEGFGINKIQNIIQAASGVTFAVLGPDLQARGLEGKLADGIKVVDYEGFVKLAAECDTVQSWL